jgi:hypothetical protein
MNIQTVAFIILLCIAGPASAKTKPNFVIFFADDLGYGDVGYSTTARRTIWAI